MVLLNLLVLLVVESAGWWWHLREGLPVEGQGPGGAPPPHALRPLLHGGPQGVGGLPGGGGNLPGVEVEGKMQVGWWWRW